MKINNILLLLLLVLSQYTVGMEIENIDVPEDIVGEIVYLVALSQADDARKQIESDQQFIPYSPFLFNFEFHPHTTFKDTDRYNNNTTGENLTWGEAKTKYHLFNFYKTLTAYRCVCKNWNSIIDKLALSSNYLKTHKGSVSLLLPCFIMKANTTTIEKLLAHKILDVSIKKDCSPYSITVLHHPHTESNYLMLQVTRIYKKTLWPLLHYAVYAKNIRVTELLLESGVDVNGQDCCGTTALHIACGFNYDTQSEECIKTLINHNADPTIDDEKYQRPSDYTLDYRTDQQLKKHIQLHTNKK